MLSSTLLHNNEVNTCTDIITYRNTPTGKTRKMFTPFADHPETPDFTSTWLDNNGIIHVPVYFQAYPTQALQLAITYQCCIKPSLDQILVTSASGTSGPHLSTKEAPSFPFSTSASPTRVLLVNRCVEPGATQIYCELQPEFQISKSDKLPPIQLYT